MLGKFKILYFFAFILANSDMSQHRTSPWQIKNKNKNKNIYFPQFAIQ